MLLTDIEGSTRLLAALGPRYGDLLTQHHRLMRAEIAEHAGVEVKTEGDSFFIIFRSAWEAIEAAVGAQRAFASASWPEGVSVNVRMGLHEGALELREGEYVGMELHRAARIAAAAHGGQVLISEALHDRLPDPPKGVTTRDLGVHRLRDIEEPAHLYQLDIDGLRTEFPPIASASARFEILPPELSAFVGREAQVDRVSELLGGARLLTMTGPGGTGKSRLALQVARRCLERYRQGVAFVPLAPIEDPGLVAPTIRSTLGYSEEPGRAPIETLTQQLRAQEILLILDNFEQILAAASSISDLLAGTERLTVMVTSRAALRLDGEQEFLVPPLEVPRVDRQVDPAAIAENESVRLFVDRARRARPDFRLDERNARSIALICQRLDGLPLAIELAASRIKLLTPEALLARLGRRLALLDSGTATDGRRTLRGTIDWSHDLLTPAERVAFRRLSVFAGGATLEAVEAIVPAADRLEAAAVRAGDEARDGEGADETIGRGRGEGGLATSDVLGTLGALVDHSLVRQVEGIHEPRFMMLETIREYGAERLTAAGERALVEEAHAAWFLERIEALAPGFTAGPAALDALEADHANVRAALQWAIDQERTQLALAAVASIWRFWHLRGHLREGLALCAQVAALPGADEPTAATAGALYAHASLLYWQGAAAEALERYEASLAVAREAQAPAREAEAQFALAYAYMITQSWDRAHDAARAATELYERLGDVQGAANARFADAYAASLAGDYEAAVSGIESLIPAIEATGDQFWLMNSQVVLAWTLTRIDRLDEARRLMLSILDGSIGLGDGSLEHMAINGLATIAALEGATDRALRLAGAAAAIADEVGGQAPPELVIARDPSDIARASGADDARIEMLTAEGRALSRDAVRELARAG